MVLGISVQITARSVCLHKSSRPNLETELHVGFDQPAGLLPACFDRDRGPQVGRQPECVTSTMENNTMLKMMHVKCKTKQKKNPTAMNTEKQAFYLFVFSGISFL